MTMAVAVVQLASRQPQKEAGRSLVRGCSPKAGAVQIHRVQRLFSSFANGAPGIGLLLLRLAAGAGLVAYAIGAFVSGETIASSVFGVLSLATGLLKVLGLWTPLAGVLAAVVAGWHGLSDPVTWRFDVLLGLVGLALALLGPGAWSVDARLFGWKRFEIRNGITTGSTSSKSGDDASSV